MPKQLWKVTTIVLVILALASFATPSFATTYNVNVQTDSSTYFGTTPIHVTGTVTPAPGPNTNMIITIKNSNKTVADLNSVPVGATTGAFNWTSYPGGSSYWIAGTYTINATWGGPGGKAFGIAQFTYSPTSTTTTTSSTTTTSTTSTSSTSTSSSSTSTTSSSTSKTTNSTTSSSSSSDTTIIITSTVTSTPTTSTSVSSTSSSNSVSASAPSNKGLGSLTYVIVAALVVVLGAVGLVMWRRKVASDYNSKSAR